MRDEKCPSLSFPFVWFLVAVAALVVELGPGPGFGSAVVPRVRARGPDQAKMPAAFSPRGLRKEPSSLFAPSASSQGPRKCTCPARLPVLSATVMCQSP